MGISRPRLVPADAPRTQAWLDGEITVLAAAPDETQWQWQLSIVQVAHDGSLPIDSGTRCQFAALDAPIRLQRDHQADITLLRLSVRHIDDARALRVQLPEGPSRLFNLLLRGEAEGELIARPLNGSMWLPIREQRVWFAHLLSGHAHVQAADEHIALDTGSSMWIDARPGERVYVEGGGELLLAHLSNPT